MSNISTPLCLHCRKAIEDAYQTDFCCAGCYFVFQFITSHDLGKYYKILEKLSENTSSLINRNENEIAQFEDENLNKIFETSADEYAFFLPDIKCAACLWLIERILKNYPQVEDLNINLMQKTLTFREKKEAFSSLNSIAKDLYLCGYKPLPLPFASSQEFRSEQQKSSLREIAISGFAASNIMLLYFAIYFGHFFGIEENIKNSFYLISMLISVPSVLYSGRPFFINSLRALRARRIHIDITISFALIITLMTSMYATFFHKDYIYFDTLTSLVFLLLVSRYLHEKYLSKAQELGEFVETLIPKDSFLISPGDIVEIPLGKTIPVDGKILSGCTEVNEAALTGEERAVLKQVDDRVLAGSQNLTQPITIQAEKTGNETWIAQLSKLILQARQDKSHTETQLEKMLPFFTYSILFIAIFSLILWYFINPQHMLSVFTALLVVTCPCALALAAPFTFSMGLKTFWKQGVIIKNSSAIETLTKIDTIILDKTGTLTSEFISIHNIVCCEKTTTKEQQKNALAILALVAKRSLHPIAKAIAHHYFDPTIPVNIKEVHEYPGLGMQAEAFNEEGEIIFIKLGNKQFLQQTHELEQKHVFAKVGEFNFILYLEETLKEGSINFVRFLLDKKKEIYLLSGDTQSNVNFIAEKLNIQRPHAIGEMKPQEKLNFLKNLQHQKKVVLAIGDGVNDAAMLAASHVSIATHGGVDVAIQAADIFLLKKNYHQLINIFKYSSYTLITLKILILFSLFYNFIAIVIALCNLVTPLIAAILMPLSSLFVFLFALSRRGEKIWK